MLRSIPRRALLSVLCLLLPLAAACAARPARGGAGAVGGPAPELVLEALDGGRVSLGQYRGSVVLINFWATWCPPCQSEIPALQAAYEANKDRGLVVLGVDVGETRQAVRPFVAGRGIGYPVLLDEQQRMLVRFGGLGLPLSVLVDAGGTIRERKAGVLSEAEIARYLEKYLPTD